MARNRSDRSTIRVHGKEAPDGRGRGHKRTPRACDRCRFKKSKCDGLQPCMTCQSIDSICIFSARRRRDARNWYCGMQEVVDEAFQRLYRACKESQSFPGTLPIEQDGKVTTEGILRGLGLATVPAPFDDLAPVSPSTSPSAVVALSHSKATLRAGTSVRELQQKRTEPPNHSGGSHSMRGDRSTSVPSSPLSKKAEKPEQLQLESPMTWDMSTQFDDVLDSYPWTQRDFAMNPSEATNMVNISTYRQGNIMNTGHLNNTMVGTFMPYPPYVSTSLPQQSVMAAVDDTKLWSI